MNDLLKLLSGALKPFGYHVRPYKGLNMLRIPNLNDESSIRSLLMAQSRNDKGFSPDLNSFTIYLRTCLRENRNIDVRPRVTGASVSETAFACIRSLVTSINNAGEEGTLKLVVLDDHSDAQLLERLRIIVGDAHCPVEIIASQTKGQGQSLYQQFELARETDEGLCYFVEDDYLHEPEAIQKIWRFYKYFTNQFQSHSVLYPQEHPVLYENHYPSYVLLGEDRHWRTIEHATHTLITHSDVLRKYWRYFENTKYVGNRKKRKKGSEARTTNRLFRKIPGFSPMKPLAVHLQFEGTLPPLYDWRPLWNLYYGR